jgi:hypothetical protein
MIFRVGDVCPLIRTIQPRERESSPSGDAGRIARESVSEIGGNSESARWSPVARIRQAVDYLRHP